MRSLLLFVVSTLSFATFATTNEEWIADAERSFHEVLLTCPERIWPGMDWSKTQFLFASEESQKAWLVGANSKKAELLQNAEVPPVAFKAVFSFVEFRGLRTVTIGLDSGFFDAGLSPFNLAVHEMFHHEGQKGWKTGGGSRGTLVPLDSRPRYVRAEMLNELKSALQDSSRIVKAGEWYKEWTDNFAAEVASSTDGYEGTANYVEQLTGIFQKKGCGISESDLHAEIRASSDLFHISPGMELDTEGYPMGALAGFLMDLQGTEWKSAIPTGITPVTQLLNGKGSAAPVTNPELSAKYAKTFADLNAKIDVWRLPFESKLADAEYVRVSVPDAWGQGSYSPKGFYIPASRQELTYIPFNGEHKFASGKGEWITAADDSVSYQGGEEVCANTAWYFLIAKKDIQESNGTFRLDTGEVTFDMGGEYKTGADGFTYLCSGTKPPTLNPHIADF